MPTVQDVLSDPKFDSLSPEAQSIVIGKIDPKFKALSLQAQPLALKGLRDRYSQMTPGEMWAQPALGMLKGAGEQLANIGSLSTRGLRREDIRETFKATNAGQAFGKGVEEIGSYLLPVTPELKVAEGASTLLRAGAAAVHGAADFALKTWATTGDVKDTEVAAVTGALGGGAFEAIRNPAGRLLSKAARNLYEGILKPRGGKVAGMASKTLLNQTTSDIVGRGITGKSSEALETRAHAEMLRSM